MNGLWRNADFLKLWSGQTISRFGSQITLLAVPITAAVLLQATPAQMGLLTALELLPALGVGLFAGVWVDRLPRRSVLIGVDILRALILLVIPFGNWFGFLSMPLLYGLSILMGPLTFLFDVAYRSYLPNLVPLEDLVEANSKLEVTNSLSYMAGPGLAGWLIDLLSAPVALAVDAASFLFSAGSLAWIRQREPTPQKQIGQERDWQKVTSGWRLILNQPVLRAMAAANLTSNFAGGFYSALLVLFITRELGQTALFLGFMYGTGSFSGMVAALLLKKLQSRFGAGWVFITAELMIATGWLAIPLLSVYFAEPRPVILLCMLVAGFGNTTVNITATSLAQVMVAQDLLGRYYASEQFISLAGLPVGALLGGVLGTLLGVRGGLIAGGMIMLTAFLWPLLSPLREQK